MKSPIGQGLAIGLQTSTQYCPISHCSSKGWHGGLQVGRYPEAFLLHVLRVRAEGRGEVVEWMVILGILVTLLFRLGIKGHFIGTDNTAVSGKELDWQG